MQCRTRAALELSRTRRSADDRYYYEMPEFDSVHAKCPTLVHFQVYQMLTLSPVSLTLKWFGIVSFTFKQILKMFLFEHALTAHLWLSRRWSFI